MTTPGAPQRAGVLLVDDDEALLTAMNRLLRPDGLRVLTATSGEQALQVLEQHGQALGAIISDYAMPGMTGADLLRAVRLRWPDLTRVLATGNADLAAAARAVNEGQLSRLVTKPWEPEEFREIVLEAVNQHRMLIENRRLRELADDQAQRLERQAERLEQWNKRLEEEVAARTSELEVANASLQRGMLDAVRLLVAFLERRLPARAARSREIARLCGRLAERAGISANEIRRIQVVHDIGLLGLPESLTRTSPENLPPSGFIQYKQHPVIAHSMLGTVENLADIASWIRAHHERWDGTGYPDRLVGPVIPLPARLIALVDGYLDAVETERPSAAIWRRKQVNAGAFDPDLLMLLDREISGEPEPLLDVRTPIEALEPGMRLEEAVKTTAGAVLIRPGEVLSADQIARLQSLAGGGALATDAVYVSQESVGAA